MASLQQLVYVDKIPLDPGETTSADPRKSWLFADANLVKSVVNSKADDTLATATATGLVPAKSATATDVLLAGSGANPTWGPAPIPAGVLRTANNLSEIATGGGQSAARTNLGLGSLATLSSVGTSQIDNTSITYAKIQNVTTSRMLGRVTAGNGVMEELTAAQVKSFLQIASTDITNFTSAVQALITSPNPAAINHNLLLNYVANQHIDHTTVTITGTNGLSGGGNIAANRTIALALETFPAATIPVDLSYKLLLFQEIAANNDPFNPTPAITNYFKVPILDVLTGFSQEDQQYESSSNFVQLSNITSTRATLTVLIDDTIKNVKRRVVLQPSVTSTELDIVLATPSNGTEGTIYLRNESGITKQVYFPTGSFLFTGKTSPQALANGEMMEISFVFNGVETVWSWIINIQL